MRNWIYKGDTTRMIADGAPFTDDVGTAYPPGFPKSEIDGMVECFDLAAKGEGSDVIYGVPQRAGDRYSRTVTRNKSAADLRAEETQWVRDRGDAYQAAVLDAKGYPEGGKIDAIGFNLDMIAAELQALRAGDPLTEEFAAFLAARAAVKEAIPKP